MSAKRTSTESNLDEQTVECSDSVFQQEDDAKRAKLVSPSDATLQDLPYELLECILFQVVAMEVKDAMLAKSAWKEKADLVIGRLRTVCSQWSSILSTNFFRNKVHRILEGTVQETIRLEILQQFSIKIYAIDVTTMKDEIFVLGTKDWKHHEYFMYVYDRNNMEEVKDVIQLPQGSPLCPAACSVSNCVYMLNRKHWCKVSVLRIAKGGDNQFNVSVMMSDKCLPNPTLSVTTNGGLILSKHRGEEGAVISIYDANGSLQHEMSLRSEISNLNQIIPKSNGNLVLVSREKGRYKAKLTEIDLNGTILRQYLPSASCNNMKVSQADSNGRMMIIEQQTYRIVLLDSELNLLDFSFPQQERYYRLRCSFKFHYNSERNEIVSFFQSNALYIVRFTDE